MSEIFFIRHGQASFGKDNYDRLSPLGIRQAGIVARYLADLGYTFDAIYHGTLERQKKTAGEFINYYRQSALPVVKPVLCEDFDEFDSYRVWEFYISDMLEDGTVRAEDLEQVTKSNKIFQGIFEKILFRWISTEYDSPEEVRWDQFSSRVKRGIDDLMQANGSGKKLAVFTSGGPISVAIQKALELSDQQTVRLSYQVLNASITRFKYNAEAFTLAGFNDVSHLEREKEKGLVTYR
jgi:broad specificity phosphatase PhoE